MPGPAQVRSTDAVEALSAALARFAERVQSALDALDGEMHRADDWIEHDRPGHWRMKIREAEDGVHQGKLDLERCLLMTTVDGQRPACREQKAALAEAKARLEYCREKAEKVRHWQRSFRHEMFEYDGRIGQLRGLLDQQVPAARGVLAKILRRLEEYQIERAPESTLAAEPDSAAANPSTLTRSPLPTDETTQKTVSPTIEPALES
jgi:hypothetical protein